MQVAADTASNAMPASAVPVDGLTDLRQLLQSLQPAADPIAYYFCSLTQLDADLAAQAFAVVKEDEGWTLILPAHALPDADEAACDVRAQLLRSSAAFQRITLKVHSSLQAVGLTAAVSTALATHNISCNLIAGFYHDHLFVPVADAATALALLEQLSADMRRMHTGAPAAAG